MNMEMSALMQFIQDNAGSLDSCVNSLKDRIIKAESAIHQDDSQILEIQKRKAEKEASLNQDKTLLKALSMITETSKLSEG